MTKKSKEIFHALLYLALLASGVFAAWQVHVWWMGRAKRPGGVDLQTYRADPSRHRSGDFVPFLAGSRPADLAGLEPMSGDPEGLPPPSGAIRRMAFRRTAGAEQQLLARYDYPGSIEAAGAYYLELMRGRGYRLLSDSPAQGRRSLNFGRDGQKANLLLEKSRSRDDLVSIVLVVTCPAVTEKKPLAAR